jgi:cytochrome P450
MLLAYHQNSNKSTQNTLIKLIESIDISDEQKVAEIVIYIIGGHDTTGYTLAMTLVLLRKHSDKEQTLHKELN